MKEEVLSFELLVQAGFKFKCRWKLPHSAWRWDRWRGMMGLGLEVRANPVGT